MDRPDDKLSELAICAVRYALGRATYVSESVPNAIIAILPAITTHILSRIVADIDMHKDRYGHIGMQCDEDSWMAFKQVLLNELYRRSLEWDKRSGSKTK